MSDYTYVNATGVIVPNTSAVLAEVQSEWTGALPPINVNQSSSPQGVMIAAEVAARSTFLTNNAAVANQINPNQAGGIFLDAICALSGLEREPNTFTTVTNVVLAGVQSSPIASGSQAKTPNGDVFALQNAVTLDPVTGQATGTFVAVNPGPIAAPAGSWTIVSDVLGWETVTNPVQGIPGLATQSDQALRALRRSTLALQSNSLPETVSSNLSLVNGVLSFRFLENYTSTLIVVGDVTLVPNSIWVCVDGGSTTDVATSLLNSKSGGCNWNGATVVNVTEPVSGQVYVVKYDVPTLIPILVRVTCSQGSFVGNPDVAVVQAVLDFANNVIPNLEGIVVGENVSPFEIATAIMSECQGLFISNVELTLASSVNYQPVELVMQLFQKATIGSGAITVVIV